MVAVAMAAGVVFGTAPAIQATSSSLLEALREGGHGSTGERRAWLRHSLVVAQVALALMLLICSSLFVRSFLNLQGSKVGFDTAPLMTMRFSLSGETYQSADARVRRVEDVVDVSNACPVSRRPLLRVSCQWVAAEAVARCW